MYLTYLDSNSWLIEMGDQRILVDPWLVGPLMFGNLPWLFKAERPVPRPIPDAITLILLSQGLADHAHRPTLEQFDRQIPVIASPNGAKVVQDLGYRQVTTLNHSETITMGSLKVQAVPGSPIGPALVENGYVLTDVGNPEGQRGASCQSLYYEPHGYHSPSLAELAPVDVVITPLIDLEIPLVGSVIKGQKTGLQVAKWLQPRVMLPTAAGGDITFKGLLIALLRAKGSVEDFRFALAQNQLQTQVIDPLPGERFEVTLGTPV